MSNRSDLWEAHFNLALAYGQMRGKELDAISEFRTALRLKPDSSLVYFHMGNTFHKLGRLPEAIEAYQASVRLDPAVPEVHYELAYALAQVPGRVPEAIEECRKMLVLKPGDEPGRQLLTSLLAFQNRRN
jgi:tetratricopeptide (TPR) repeat protein